MADIKVSTSEQTYKINKFLGLNENPDGDTKLKSGEAAVCQNWKITRDHNLRRRPGNRQIIGLLQGYEINVSPTAVAAYTGNLLPLYEDVELGNDANFTMLGEAVSVTPENYADYIGYYWQENVVTIWQLEKVSPTGDSWSWYFKLVTAVPDTNDDNYKVQGLWNGLVNGREELLAACNGHLYRIWDEETQQHCKIDLGEIDMENRVSFLGFNGIVYMLNGKEYMQFDGEQLSQVTGYRPLVAREIQPTGGGALAGEEVNKLTGAQRVWISPDGTGKTFTMPLKDLLSVDYVMDNSTGELLDSDDYTFDLAAGTVTFDTAPTASENKYEVGYTSAATLRSEVAAMTNFETFLGAQDNTVFVYGDGSNQCFYSGVDYNGHPRADYFPDQNEMEIGTANEPITSLIRHYSRMIVYKPHETWSVSFGTITTADNNVIYGFYSTPVNRSLGNQAKGQTFLVLNSPRTVCDNDIYEWKSNSQYSSALTADERQAQRISDRIYNTLSSFDLPNCLCWDDNINQEWYCFDPESKIALVNNYAANAWYTYTDMDVTAACNFGKDLLFGTSNGELHRLSYDYKTNNGKAIKSYWESGSEDFGKPFMRKFSNLVWLTIKPESRGFVKVTVSTDRKSNFVEREVESFLLDFGDIDFGNFTFDVNRSPQIHRLKIKAKKFVYWKLIIETDDLNTSATVLEADIKVRFTGEAK